KTPRAGWRAPEAALAGTSLFSQMSGPGFHLLCFGASDPERLAVEEALRGTGGLVSPIYIDGAEEARRRYGVNEAACILVRPDGNIATRSPDADAVPDV